MIPAVLYAIPHPKEFKATGDCFDLISQYLDSRGEPYIVDASLRGRDCSFYFRGNNLDAQFQTFCKKNFLKCGGKPYFVGYDSTFFAGQKIPTYTYDYAYSNQDTSFVSCADSSVITTTHKLYSVNRKRDLLLCAKKNAYVKPLPFQKFVLNYYSFSSSLLDQWGIEWSKVLASGDFFSKPSIPLNWSIRALGELDTLAEFRSIVFSFDSSFNVTWGAESKELDKTYTQDGVITQDYSWRDYGLIITVTKDTLSYKLTYSFVTNDDNHNKLNGSSVSSLSDTLQISGYYKEKSNNLYYVPFLGRIPVIGYLFRYRNTGDKLRFFVLRLLPLSGT